MTENRSRVPALAYVFVTFLALGAALYVALGVDPRLSNGAAAYVNGNPIPSSEYARAIKAMQAGLERPLTEADHERAMERLIDEELIVQEAIKLGLPSSDRLVRRNLVQGMMRSVTSLETSEITEADLREFFEENRNMFAAPRLVTIEVVTSQSSKASTAFVTRVQSGESFTAAAKAVGLTSKSVPEKLPLGKVSSHLGGPAVEMVSRMKPGDIAGPAQMGASEIFIWMTESYGGEASFDDTKEAIKAELQRRKDEVALDAYIARLRRQARIKKATLQP